MPSVGTSRSSRTARARRGTAVAPGCRRPTSRLASLRNPGRPPAALTSPVDGQQRQSDEGDRQARADRQRHDGEDEAGDAERQADQAVQRLAPRPAANQFAQQAGDGAAIGHCAVSLPEGRVAGVAVRCHASMVGDCGPRHDGVSPCIRGGVSRTPAVGARRYRPRMQLELTALVVTDYDEAIRFFVDVLGFELAEDSPSLTNDGRPKRWVVVRPPGAPPACCSPKPTARRSNLVPSARSSPDGSGSSFGWTTSTPLTRG